MADKKQWLDIPEFEGLYKISNYGEIKSYDKLVSNRYRYILRKGKIIKPSIKRNGYKQVVLVKDGKRYTRSVHRLVAQAFIDNSNNLPQVNHKDKNKLNNHVNNLEWCTSEYNTRYSCGVKIRQHDLKLSKTVLWSCASEASNSLGISLSAINNCLNGRSKTAGGFIWRYCDAHN